MNALDVWHGRASVIGVMPPGPRDIAVPGFISGDSHLALVTPDMDATVRFYAGTLGTPLVMTLMAGPMRYYFFEIALQNTVAFFEIPDAETFTKGAGSPGPYPVQFDHISFGVPDERALFRLQDRIRAAGFEVTELVDHGVMKSVYFTDPKTRSVCEISDSRCRVERPDPGACRGAR